MRRIVAFAALLLVVVCIPGCAYASWLMVTGGSWGWQLALLSLVVLVASLRIRGGDEDPAPTYAIFGLALAVPVAVMLPLAHVGHYAHHGGPLALVLSFSGGAVLAFFVVMVLVVMVVLGIFASLFKTWS